MRARPSREAQFFGLEAGRLGSRETWGPDVSLGDWTRRWTHVVGAPSCHS